MKIISDTREKYGWDFAFYDDVEVVMHKLPCGDYTTEKLKSLAVVERKATPNELSINLGKNASRARLYKEFDKMKELEHAYIVCEFYEKELLEFPQNSKLPKHVIGQIKVGGKYLHKLVLQIPEVYENLQIVFCENRNEAESFVYTLFKNLESKYN